MFESVVYAMGQAPQQQGEAPNPIISLMPLILMFVIFYFLLIRPQQKKQKEHKQMLSELKKNDQIVTSGGIYGTIVNLKDNTYVVRVDDNVKIEILKSAVSAVVKKTDKPSNS